MVAPRSRKLNWVIGFGLLAILATLGAESTEAATIRSSNRLKSLQVRAQRRAYFQEALRARSLTVPRSKLSALVTDGTGLLADDPMVDYLRWRRSLAPARFDQFHPQISSLLIRDEQLRPTTNLPGIVTPPTTRPTTPVVPVGPAVPQIPVPEPGSMVVALVMAGGFAVWRRRAMGRANRGA